MQAKFRKKLSDYDYLVMFDLAMKTSGVCVWSLRSNVPMLSRTVVAENLPENPSVCLYKALDGFFVDFTNITGEPNYDRVLVYREMCPLQQGGHTTAKTLSSLGRAHATLDIYQYEHDIDYYDENGVSPSTTHAHYKRILGLDPKAKVTKEDIHDYVVREYGLDPRISCDESDAVFLAKTFVERFWDAQIDERIREEKRHRKALKAPSAIAAVDAEIRRLTGLKTQKED